MAVYQTELMDRERIARDTMAFWLLTDGCQYEFRAGQNADFVLANPLVGSTDIARDLLSRKLSTRPGFDHDCHADVRLGVQDHPAGGSEWHEV
jgi:hypothetical protein